MLAHRHAGHDYRAAFEVRPSHRLAAHAAEYGRLVVAMLDGVQNYHRACGASPRQKDACIDSMYVFLSSLEQLNTRWCQGLVSDDLKQRMPLHIRPKVHMIQHLGEDQLDLWGSPRNFNCCVGEHFIGSMKTVRGCTKHQHAIGRVVLQKSRLAAGVAEEWLCRECGP